MSDQGDKKDSVPAWGELKALQSQAECLVSPVKIREVIDSLAADIAETLGDQVPVVICVMNGGLPLTGALLQRWDFLLELDYVHASRYGQATSGGDINWRALPQTDLKDRTVLVVDDIFDEGNTLSAIIDWCAEAGAKSVKSCVLVEKMHDRKNKDLHRPDFIGLQTEDKYLFGCGMDYKGFYRNLEGIYALPEDALD